MRIRSRAPVRIDFLGGGSDAPPFSREHGGAVVNGGINHYATCTLETGSHLDGVEINSMDLGQSVKAESVNALVFDGHMDLIKSAVRRSGIGGALRLTTHSGVPAQSGLGASGSVAVSVLAACLHAQGRHAPGESIAETAVEAERLDLGNLGGRQDQYAAAFGGLHQYTFMDPAVERKRLLLSREAVAELEHNLLLAYTGVTHLSGSIHRDIRDAYADEESPCKKAMYVLRDIANEGAECLRREHHRDFALLLNENWLRHKDLHPSCTNDRLERIYDMARSVGIVGGKTCGAGGGGCVVFYCEEGRKPLLAKVLEREGCAIIPFSFDFNGVITWELATR